MIKSKLLAGVGTILLVLFLPNVLLAAQTVTIQNTANGLVFSNQPEIDCGNDCSAVFDPGTEIILGAIPEDKYMFSRWLIDDQLVDDVLGCNQETYCAFTIASDDVDVWAFFDEIPDPDKRYLSVIKSGTGDGLVFDDRGAVSCGTNCTGEINVDIGDEVTLTAIPDNLSTFEQWYGACEGSVDTCTFVVTSPHSQAAAVFKRLPEAEILELSVIKSGEGDGIVFSYPAGIDCRGGCEDDNAEFGFGTVITLEAIPNNVSNLSDPAWQGCPDDPDNNVADPHICAFKITQNTTVIASFDRDPTKISHTLELVKIGEGDGLVISDPPGIRYPVISSSAFPGGTVVLRAEPNPASEFAGWQGGACLIPDTDTCEFIIDRDTVITARFNPRILYPLTINKTGTGTGLVFSHPAGINCGSACAKDFDQGTQITLKAIADNLSVFSGWEGGTCSDTGDCTINLNEATNVVARFTRIPPAEIHQLAVVKTGDGNGRVLSDPSGIDCGSKCSKDYSEGTGITLYAFPDINSVFTGWQGACTGSGSVCVIDEFQQDATVIANFDRDPSTDTRVLTVIKSGSANGLVFSNPSGINLGTATTGSASFVVGTLITLRALPANNVEFGGWQGDVCSGLEPTCTFTLTQSTTVIAVFDQIPDAQTRTLSVIKTGSGDGLVFSNPSGIACGSDCEGEFALGTEITLTANPDSVSVFAGWQGVSCSNAVCTLTITEHTTIIARFDRKPGLETRTVTVVKTGNGGGLVFSNPSGIACGSDCEEEFALGAEVTLTAVPDSDSAFGGWQGGACSGTTPVCKFTVNADITITAGFREIPDVLNYTLTVVKAGSGDGLVFSNPGGIGAGSASAVFAQGTRVTLTALPTANNTFTGWQGACTGTNPVCTLTISQNTTVLATFEAAAYHSLTILKIGTGSGLVYSNPSGVAWGVDIDCGSDCSTRFRHGTEIVLSAAAIGDSAFAGWGSGVCSGQGTDCTLTINDNYTIVVEFRRIAAGALITTITPPQAIDAGARWRVNNGIWNLSGARADNLPPGSNTVEYASVTGWKAPSPQSVIVTDGGISTTSAHYTRATGRLKILLSPPEALRSGVQWRVNDSIWYDSGTELQGVAGQQRLDFRSVANWVAPAGVGVLVNNGESLIQTYTYTRQAITPAGNQGSITVHIAPSNIDAQWKLTGLTGDEVWRRSGETRSGLKVASAYTITFSHVAERWQRPRDIVTLLGSGAITAARRFHVNYLDLAATDCLFNWLETEYGLFFNPPSTTSTAPVDHTDLLYRCYAATNTCVGAHETRLLYYGPLSDNTLLDAGSTAAWYHFSNCRE